MDGEVEGPANGQPDEGWASGHDGHMDGWTEGWMDGLTET